MASTCSSYVKENPKPVNTKKTMLLKIHHTTESPGKVGTIRWHPRKSLSAMNTACNVRIRNSIMVSDPQLYVKKWWFLTNKIKFGREQQASWIPVSSAFKNILYKRQGVL